MELDEADEMVRLLCFRSRYPYPPPPRREILS